jgi:hypothetical protein
MPSHPAYQGVCVPHPNLTVLAAQGRVEMVLSLPDGPSPGVFTYQDRILEPVCESPVSSKMKKEGDDVMAR